MPRRKCHTSKYPAPRKIRVSEDYKEFNFLSFNRNLNRANVNKLITQNQEKFEFHKFPLIVDKNKSIIDGQHRFTACKEMGAPIYYIVDSNNNVDWRDIHRVNKAGIKHSLNDKVTMLLKSGNPVLKEAKTFYEKNIPKEFSFTNTVRLLHEFNVSGSTIRALDEGEIVLSYKEETIKLFHFINEISKDDKVGPADSGFIFALALVAKNTSMGVDKFFQKCLDLRHMIDRKNRREQYIEMIREIHNYKLAEKNRLTSFR
jgi:hypothetical protein